MSTTLEKRLVNIKNGCNKIDCKTFFLPIQSLLDQRTEVCRKLDSGILTDGQRALANQLYDRLNYDISKFILI